MSYDVSVCTPACGTCGRAESWESWNYTSNMAPAWRRAGADLAGFDGRPAAECAIVLTEAVAQMRANPAEFARFDAPNGWGSMDTLLPALDELLALLRAHPGGTVRVSR